MTPSTHGLGPTRARVLSLLQSAPSPLSVVVIADKLGLHRNSARFHLDALVEAGYASAAKEQTGQQGRPPLLYSVSAEAPTLNNAHLVELTSLLIANFVAPIDGALARAEEVGRGWGRSVVEDEDTAGEEALADLVAHLGERGFATVHDDENLRFTRCPFRSTVAPEHMPLVCAMHQGFLDGYLDSVDTGVEADRIVVGARECVARLRSPLAENSQQSAGLLPRD